MLNRLAAEQLSVAIDPAWLEAADTPADNSTWIGQPRARQAAEFGLQLRQPGMHLLVEGEPGSGRTSLMLSAMRRIAADWPAAADLVYLHHFSAPEKPLALPMQAASGALLRSGLEQMTRELARHILGQWQEASAGIEPGAKSEKTPVAEAGPGSSALESVAALLDARIEQLKRDHSAYILQAAAFEGWLAELRQDLLDQLQQLHLSSEPENQLEACLNRYRANLLVDQRYLCSNGGAPVLHDDDPSLASLFGGCDASENQADVLRLRAGNLLRAHGGMLLLHLSDLLADTDNNLLGRLLRVLRNGRIQLEETVSGQHPSALAVKPEPLPLDVKIVLIATAEERDQLHDTLPELAGFFPVKVDFSERMPANADNYRAIAAWLRARCQALQLPACSAGAVAVLLQAMHRKIEDQRRLSTHFGELQQWLIESAAIALQQQSPQIQAAHVTDAMQQRRLRSALPEQGFRDAIADGEILIRVSGEAIGQINGLTHIDLGDTSFGSPVRISARCSAGAAGIINIDREVEMTGPNHDKGLFILQSWLTSQFVTLTPLSLNAALVFEQEYHGVEGDSASCAELYALLSALACVPLRQGVALTGALNQHGDVMAIGGVNEKIEGYFRLCQQLGLDGEQGVLIPESNLGHLVLDAEVQKAVAAGQFHLYSMHHVLDGLACLSPMPIGAPDGHGHYAEGTLLRQAHDTLQRLREYHHHNRVALTP